MIKHVCAGLTALFFAALSLQAENKVVKLPRVVATNTASVEIKQIELSDTATVLDMGAWYRPHYWIRISKDTYLRGDDGKKYPVRFGSGIKLDTELWMPDSGTASFKLHFPALPKSVKSFDFIESDCEDCFKIYGVSLQGDTPVSVPEDYRSAETGKPEALPEPRIEGGNVTVVGKLLEYQPFYDLKPMFRIPELWRGSFAEYPVTVNEDGSFTATFEVASATQVALVIGTMNRMTMNLFVCPGDTLYAAVNLPELTRRNSHLRKDAPTLGQLCHFRGKMAAINNEMTTRFPTLPKMPEGQEFMLDIAGMSPNQYKAYCLEKERAIEEAVQSDATLSEACRTLYLNNIRLNCIDMLNMLQPTLAEALITRDKISWEDAYAKVRTNQPDVSYFDYLKTLPVLNDPQAIFSLSYPQNVLYSRYLPIDPSEGKTMFRRLLESGKVEAADVPVLEKYDAMQKENQKLDEEAARNLAQKYMEVLQEISNADRSFILDNIIKPNLSEGKGYYFDLLDVMTYAGKLQDFMPFTESDKEAVRNIRIPYFVNKLEEMNNQLLVTIEENKKKSGYTVNEVGEVSNEDLFYSMVSKFKGKVVLVDFWATWCGPCRMAMKQMLPMKEQLKDKDIIYLFIAGENSPKQTWENMIPDIHGEHYRVTDEQWNFLSQKFAIEGVPTYILLDKEGAIAQKYTGFPGVDTMKNRLLELCK